MAHMVQSGASILGFFSLVFPMWVVFLKINYGHLLGIDYTTNLGVPNGTVIWEVP